MAKHKKHPMPASFMKKAEKVLESPKKGAMKKMPKMGKRGG